MPRKWYLEADPAIWRVFNLSREIIAFILCGALWVAGTAELSK